MSHEKSEKFEQEKFEFNRGTIQPISSAMGFLERAYSQEHDIRRVKEIANSGFTHVLRIPRENVGECVATYGPRYDKLKDYHDFIKTIAEEVSGYRPEHPFDSFYFFKSEDDARRVMEILKFRQANLDLPLPKMGEKKK